MFRSFSIHRDSVLIVLLPLALLAATAQAHSRNELKQPELSGIWRLNLELSEEGYQITQTKTSDDRLVLTNWREPSQGKQPARLRELLEATRTLEIHQRGRQLTMNATGSDFVVLTRTVYTDGRRSQHSFGLGDKGESQARWSEQKFILETDLNRGSRLTESYELSPGGDRMSVLVKIEAPGWSQPILIRRIYDKDIRHTAILTETLQCLNKLLAIRSASN